MTQRPTLSVGVAVVRRSAMGFREPALIAGLDRRSDLSLVRGTMLEGCPNSPTDDAFHEETTDPLVADARNF